MKPKSDNKVFRAIMVDEKIREKFLKLWREKRPMTQTELLLSLLEQHKEK